MKSESVAMSSEPGATPDAIAVVREGLHRFNFAATGLTQHHEVILLLRDAGGAIRGGLERAASGEVFSRFHAEAGIAAEHCLAPSFAQTRWREVSDLYAMLERIDPSPLHTMNRAVALAEWQGPEAGLALLEGLAPPAWLADAYLWDAVLSDLHRRAGNMESALRHRERALASAPTEVVRDLIRHRQETPG